jgi:hypothetical protein
MSGPGFTVSIVKAPSFTMPAIQVRKWVAESRKSAKLGDPRENEKFNVFNRLKQHAVR